MKTPVRGRQDGVILLVAVVALILLSFVAMRQLRAVDVNSRLAANLAFKHAATQSAERGIDEATRWLRTEMTTGRLESDQPALGYWSTFPPADVNWVHASNWGSGQSVALPRDDAGQLVDFRIHRLCTTAGPPGAANDCMPASPASASSGSSRRVNGPLRQNQRQVQYQVTVRVRGPRGATSIVQTMILGGA